MLVSRRCWKPIPLWNSKGATAENFQEAYVIALITRERDISIARILPQQRRRKPKQNMAPRE